MCAPTLAGLKTGSMFSASYRSEAKVKAELRRLNGLFKPKGLVIMPLRFSGATSSRVPKRNSGGLLPSSAVP